MKVTWEVADGYVGKSRPQSFEIDPDDFVYCLESDEDIKEELYNQLNDDFRNKVYAEFTDDIDEIVAQIKEALVE